MDICSSSSEDSETDSQFKAKWKKRYKYASISISDITDPTGKLTYAEMQEPIAARQAKKGQIVQPTKVVPMYVIGLLNSVYFLHCFLINVSISIDAPILLTAYVPLNGLRLI